MEESYTHTHTQWDIFHPYDEKNHSNWGKIDEPAGHKLGKINKTVLSGLFKSCINIWINIVLSHLDVKYKKVKLTETENVMLIGSDSKMEKMRCWLNGGNFVLLDEWILGI